MKCGIILFSLFKVDKRAGALQLTIQMFRFDKSLRTLHWLVDKVQEHLIQVEEKAKETQISLKKAKRRRFRASPKRRRIKIGLTTQFPVFGADDRNWARASRLHAHYSPIFKTGTTNVYLAIIEVD
jgi:hypothetical protein